ncbi:penicillin-binding protein activator [Pelagibacteraceae bacterium]|nr:penicillin-binding protein activator [Pelagibacteraceae bacterium]
MKSLINNLIILLFSFTLISCHEKDYDVMDALFNIKKEPASSSKIKNAIHKDIEKKKKEEKKNNKNISDKKKSIIKKNIEAPNSIKSRVLKEKKQIPRQNNNILETPTNLTDDENTIKIGVLLPLSGKNSEIGNMILNALELAIFQNKESSIELVIEDTQSESSFSKKAFQQLLERKISFVIGPLYSKTLTSINDQVKNNQINILALSNNKNLAKKGVWIFGVDPKEQTERILDYALEKGLTKTAALLPKNSYGLLLFDTISNYKKNGIIGPVRVEFYEDNIKSQQNAAKKLAKGFDKYESYIKKIDSLESQDNIVVKEVNKPFDNVIIAASGQALTVLSSQLQYNNVDPEKVQFLGTSSWEDLSILNEPALEGGVFAATSQLFQKDIKRIYKNTFEKDMPKVAMIAYDILALLIAIEKDKKTININDLINKEGFLGLRGLFRLSKSGTVERSFDLKTIKNKKFIVYDKANNFF